MLGDDIIKIILYIIIFIALADIYCIFTMPKVNRWKYKDLTSQDIDIVLQHIKQMNGREFELFMDYLFKMVGYRSDLTKSTNDKGKDIILTEDDRKIYVECKCWDENNADIGRPILQKLIGSCASDNIKEAIIVTTSNYNKNAINYCKEINQQGQYKLQLWDESNIKDMIRKINSTELLKYLGYDYEYWEETID